MQDFVVDIFAFCRDGESRTGKVSIADLERLQAEIVGGDPFLVWQIEGGVNSHGLPQANVSVSARLKLRCQRCLAPYDYEISSGSVLIFAKSEQHADEIEELLDDDEIDVVVGSKSFNLFDLIEDDALLALPQSPKHDVCPDQVQEKSAIDRDLNAVKESPFAVLKNLKSGQ